MSWTRKQYKNLKKAQKLFRVTGHDPCCLNKRSSESCYDCQQIADSNIFNYIGEHHDKWTFDHRYHTEMNNLIRTLYLTCDRSGGPRNLSLETKRCDKCGNKSFVKELYEDFDWLLTKSPFKYYRSNKFIKF